jgi:hypothetical protein
MEVPPTRTLSMFQPFLDPTPHPIIGWGMMAPPAPQPRLPNEFSVTTSPNAFAVTLLRSADSVATLWPAFSLSGQGHQDGHLSPCGQSLGLRGPTHLQRLLLPL